MNRSIGHDTSAEVIGRGSIYTLGTAGPVLAQVVVTPVVTRLLGSGPYGVVAKALVVVQIVMMIGGLGMPAVITRHAILGGSGAPGARAILVRGGLITVVLVGLTVAIQSARGLGDGAVTAYALIAGGFAALLGNAQAFLRALDAVGAFVVASLVGSVGGPLLGMALVVLWSRTPLAYVVGLAGGYAVAAAVGSWLSLGGGHTAYARGDLGAAFRLGLPVLPHLVSLFLAQGALVMIAGHVFGEGDAGRMQLALFLGTAPAVVTAALNNSWAPAIYRVDEARRGAALEHSARDIGWLTALMAAGVSILAPWLLRFVAPASFAPDALVAPVAVVSLGAMLSVAYLANVHLVFAAGKSLGLSITSPISLLIGLAAALLGAQHGLAWLAWGFPATYLALGVLTAVLRRVIGASRWRERALVAPFLAGAALVAAGGLLPATGSVAYVRLAVAAVEGYAGLVMIRRILRGSRGGTGGDTAG